MRILFIESDRDLRSFFGSKLKDEFKGTLDIVSTGKEAIKLLRTERPYDVIVSDYFLPNGSGLDLLHFKVKSQINGAFIFFCTFKGEIPYSQEEYLQVDKFSLGLLCEEIRLLRGKNSVNIS
jgi:CheY-like chemotaxis protein